MRLPFRILEPTFCAGLRDDPLLLVRERPAGRSLLLDCGQMTHLAKRLLRSIDAVFVSHMHMDHFMGLDTLVRHLHVAPRELKLFGPPGLAARVACKLGAYDWNLAEPHWCTLLVTEVHPDRLARFALAGARGFVLETLEALPRVGNRIYYDPWVTVEGVLCDHKIPVLVLRLTETPVFRVDPQRLEAAGLSSGAWLRQLKRWFYAGQDADARLTAEQASGKSCELSAPACYQQVRALQPPASIGYFSDLGWSAENLEQLRSLLGGVTLLVCECTFLAAEQEKARASYHLCTRDVNELARELRPAFLLPMHLSKTYQGRSAELYAELDPPPGTTLLALPEHVPPRPLLPGEFPRWTAAPARGAA